MGQHFELQSAFVSIDSIENKNGNIPKRRSLINRTHVRTHRLTLTMHRKTSFLKRCKIHLKYSV